MNPGTTKDDSEEVPAQENFVRELTRRRVVQVALLYFAIAWTATEVLSFLFESIPVFPVWSKTLVAVLFVLGFSDRQQVFNLGDELPLCVSNMRTNVR